MLHVCLRGLPTFGRKPIGGATHAALVSTLPRSDALGCNLLQRHPSETRLWVRAWGFGPMSLDDGMGVQTMVVVVWWCGVCVYVEHAVCVCVGVACSWVYVYVYIYV